MKAVSFTQVLDAAAYALIGERCQQAYIHDIRGGLQAINSAVELLARSVKSPAQNGALLEKASALGHRIAKRSLARSCMSGRFGIRAIPHGFALVEQVRKDIEKTAGNQLA